MRRAQARGGAGGKGQPEGARRQGATWPRRPGSRANRRGPTSGGPDRRFGAIGPGQREAENDQPACPGRPTTKPRKLPTIPSQAPGNARTPRWVAQAEYPPVAGW